VKNLSRALLLLLPLLSACGGGSTSGQLPQTALPAGSAQTPNEAQTAIMSQTQNLSAQVSADLLYIGNTGTNSITVYHHDAAGNTKPLYVISGSKTGISAPGQLSEDAQGNLYVANGSWTQPSANPAILVFAHGANGNVLPIRTISGSATGIHNVNAMTVDKATGKIFVMDLVPGNGFAYVRLLRFAPNASGNAAPLARSASGLLPALQLASDSTGHNLIEAHVANSANSVGFGVETLAKQFPSNTLPNDLSDTGYFGVSGVAADATTKTYLVTSGSGIYRMAENTTGFGPSDPFGQTLSPAPLSVLTSDTCGSQLALPPGPTPNTYVTHSVALGGCKADAVYVYTHDAAGAAGPLRVLSGLATRLNAPYGIYEGK
jgi:hypothetical protein